MGFLGVLLKVVAFIPSLVTGAESIFGPKQGDTKRNSIIGMIMTILTVSEGISGKDIVDQEKFDSGLRKVIDGVVEMLNASTWHKP